VSDDPLGLPLATPVVDGNEADDPLYEPAIKRVRTIIDQEGVLYVGDCFITASSIRASIKKANDYYRNKATCHNCASRNIGCLPNSSWFA